MDSDKLSSRTTARRQSSLNKDERTMGVFEVSLLGIGLVLGGHVQYWNAGVGVGMAEYLLCALLSASCFFCVALCLAEMTSTLPFGGGLYGFVRVTMGPYLGFLVGCCEIVQSISYPTAQLIPASHYLAGLFGLADEFSIVFFIIMIWTALAINLMGMKVFWRSNTCMIIISMSLLLVYYAAAMPCMDCDKYGRGSFVDSGKATEINDWFRGFPYSTCFFAGLEMLPLSCADATQPRKTVPRAMMIAFAFLFVNTFLAITVATCNAPGYNAMESSTDPPFHYAYAARLGITTQVAKALSVPALFASSSTFIYVYGKQLRSMSESGLFPLVLKHTYGPEKIPYVALTLGALLCLALFSLAEYLQEVVLFVFIVCASSAAVFVDVVLLLGFLRFRRNHASLPRQFRSPLGLFGAGYGIVILLLIFATSIGLYADAYLTVIILFFYLGGMSVYYHYQVKPTQSFSDEEQKVMFIAYVINGNLQHKKNKAHHPHRQSHGFNLHNIIRSFSVSSSPRSSVHRAGGARVRPAPLHADDSAGASSACVSPNGSVQGDIVSSFSDGGAPLDPSESRLQLYSGLLAVSECIDEEQSVSLWDKSTT